jgi:hypothetical protein
MLALSAIKNTFKGCPADADMEVIPLYAHARELCEGDYYESLLRRMMLDVDHKASVLLLPSETFGSEVAEREKQRLEEIRRGLDDKDIEALIKSAKNGARIILPGKTAALIKNGTLSFIREDELCRGEKKEAFLVPISEGRSDFDGFSVILCRRAEQSDLSLCKGASFTAKIFITKQTAQNIYVRNRENGDKYFFGGMTRTLKKLLTGKTEAAKRTRPVFCDGAGIFWFPGFRVRDDVYGADGEKDLVLIYAEYGG